GVVLQDATGAVITANPAAIELLGPGLTQPGRHAEAGLEPVAIPSPALPAHDRIGTGVPLPATPAAPTALDLGDPVQPPTLAPRTGQAQRRLPGPVRIRPGAR